MSNVITAHGFEIDLSAIPSASLNALARRGLVHVLGNEVASKVAAKAKRLAEGSETEVGREMTDDEKVELTAQLRGAAIEAIGAGKLGDRVATAQSSRDPLEAETHRLAKLEVLEVLRTNGFKVKGKGDDAQAFKEGQPLKGEGGEIRTMAIMIETRLKLYGERIAKEAKAALAAKAKKASGFAVEGEATTDSLGV